MEFTSLRHRRADYRPRTTASSTRRQGVRSTNSPVVRSLVFDADSGSNTSRPSRVRWSAVIIGPPDRLLQKYTVSLVLAAALYFEQSNCDELMGFKHIQTRAQPEESLKHNHSCTNMSPRTRPLLLHSGDRFVQLWLCFNDSSGCALV